VIKRTQKITRYGIGICKMVKMSLTQPFYFWCVLFVIKLRTYMLVKKILGVH